MAEEHAIASSRRPCSKRRRGIDVADIAQPQVLQPRRSTDSVPGLHNVALMIGRSRARKHVPRGSGSAASARTRSNANEVEPWSGMLLLPGSRRRS